MFLLKAQKLKEQYLNLRKKFEEQSEYIKYLEQENAQLTQENVELKRPQEPSYFG